MGVRVRLSRNTSMYLPFWVAIPVWLIWAAIMVVVVVVWGMILVLSYGAKGAVTLSRRATRAVGERQARPLPRHAEQEARRQEAAHQRAERQQAAQHARPERTVARREAARQLAAQRKARKATRPPLSWPGWGNLAAGAAALAGVVLAGVAGSNANSPLAPVAGQLLIAAVGLAAVCVPVALWRKFQVRKRARAGSPQP